MFSKQNTYINFVLKNNDLDNSTKLLKLLDTYFGYTGFRKSQEAIIHSVLKNQNTLALLPTGGGKSLCYQIPALALPGLCLVVSPLIALMDDQVKELRKRNITAFSLQSGITRFEFQNIMEAAINSNCKFLFVSPERLESYLFKEFLPALPISLIAVDETHCISQWGYDFRPSYLNIIETLKEKPDVPVLALTATATSKVQDDICQKLSIDEHKKFIVFKDSFARKNIALQVQHSQSIFYSIEQIFETEKGSAIIYCPTRKQTKEIASFLSLKNKSAMAYHAGLTKDERKNIQQSWMLNKTQIIVCTSAFGMGINKPDVRIIVHSSVPDNLESYYQEVGRAGRDGQLAQAILLVSSSTSHQLLQLSQQKFPAPEVLKSMYNALIQFLQIPVYEKSGGSYDFNLKDFLRNFNIDIHTAINSIKALEQEGWISFTEQVFQLATVQFICDRDTLNQIEENHSQYDPIVKLLLRNYEGILTFPKTISEKYISGILKIEKETVIQYLLQLDKMQVIEYHPQKEAPQIILTKDRVPSQELYINQNAYQIRKTEYEQRIQSILQYIHNHTDCRNQLICAYFDEQLEEKCGICDNCTQAVHNHTFQYIKKTIVNRIQNLCTQPTDIGSLTLQLNEFDKQDIKTVLKEMMAENMIVQNSEGLYYNKS